MYPIKHSVQAATSAFLHVGTHLSPLSTGLNDISCLKAFLLPSKMTLTMLSDTATLLSLKCFPSTALKLSGNTDGEYYGARARWRPAGEGPGNSHS